MAVLSNKKTVNVQNGFNKCSLRLSEVIESNKKILVIQYNYLLYE